VLCCSRRPATLNNSGSNLTVRQRFLLAASAVCAVCAHPASAQNVHDLSAYLATVLTTTGASPVVDAPMLGDSVNVFGVQALYTHLTFGDFGDLGPVGSVRADAFGGAVEASFLGGRLGIGANAAYIVPDCPIGFECRGNASAGGSAIVRLANAAVGDSAGRVTLSVRTAGSWSFDAGSDRYASATVGAPIAFSAREGHYRILAFGAPGIAWGSLKTKTFVNPQTGELGPFDHSGARGMLSGGIGFLPDRAGVGVQIGFQKIFVSQAGAQYGAALTWSGLFQ